MENQHKPVIIKDGMMTISSNAEGIMFAPSQQLKDIFGAKLMTDVYYKRATPKARPKGKAKEEQPKK